MEREKEREKEREIGVFVLSARLDDDKLQINFVLQNRSPSLPHVCDAISSFLPGCTYLDLSMHMHVNVSVYI